MRKGNPKRKYFMGYLLPTYLVQGGMGMKDVKCDALNKYLDAADAQPANYGEDSYECDGSTYLVLTDDEANEAAKEYIEQGLGLFNASFLVGFMTNVPEEAIQALSERMCEDAGPIFKKMIDDFDYFVEAAISADGRGNLLSGYDGEELELEGDLYAYRTD